MIQAWTVMIAICLLYAAARDVAVRLISNRLCVVVAALALPFRFVDHDLLRSIAVAGLIFIVLTVGWLLRLIGGGDVKFWTVCSLLVPPHTVSQSTFSLTVVLVGGGVGCAYLILRLVVRWRAPTTNVGASKRWFARVWRAEQWRARRKGSIPYGVAIAAAAWMTFIPSVPR
jgi:Flp pilus assembly protein protease CpaA